MKLLNERDKALYSDMALRLRFRKLKAMRDFVRNFGIPGAIEVKVNDITPTIEDFKLLMHEYLKENAKSRFAL